MGGGIPRLRVVEVHYILPIWYSLERDSTENGHQWLFGGSSDYHAIDPTILNPGAELSPDYAALASVLPRQRSHHRKFQYPFDAAHPSADIHGHTVVVVD